MNNVELTYAIKPEQIKALARFQVEMGFITQAEFDRIDWNSLINTSFVSSAGG